MDKYAIDSQAADFNSPLSSGWQFVGIVLDSQPIKVCGINPWDFKWTLLADEKPVIVAHPSHPSQRHKMDRWEIKDGERTITFAAGEFSNAVWGFYIPEAEK
jgi:hypothetical protein